MPPFVADVRRREVSMPPRMTPATRNVRPLVQGSRQQAPEAPRQGDTPARAPRVPIYTAFSMASIRAVMNDDFYIGVIAPHPGAQTLGGRQAPWDERLNIHKRSAEAYGSLLTLEPTDYWQNQF